MKKLLFVICLLCTPAEAGTVWDYNGSTFALEANGVARKFLYLTARQGLPVSAGAVIFQGRRAGDTYTGTAYTFSPKCGPAPYSVSGTVAADQRSVTLTGSVPVRNAECRTISRQNNVMTFTLREPAASTPRREVLIIGTDATIPHADLQLTFFGKEVPLDEIHPEDPGHDGSMVVALSGIEPNPLAVRRATGLRNGFATVLNDGARIIVYDPIWYGGISSLAARYYLLGHEVGHHVCGHRGGYLNDKDANWKQELEADTYAGAAIKRVGYLTIADVIEGMAQTISHQGSQTHPPINLRIAAVQNGYDKGSPCEALGIVKPRVFTEEEKEGIHQTIIEFCNELAREFCSTNEFDAKVHRHSLIKSNCEIKPLPGPITYCNPPCHERFVAFPGVDCVGGGRYRSEDISTHMKLPSK
ncbi:hypothetical protein [Bradyrhizobium sp. 131]|uniref:hypothetical protein n=1 Tax=Bradyrhizobium sp. 131 TaxID=2782609 RepID=UPI001FFE9671|nr:hypothetical protein [Bradyrhizobium sp. 131]UPK20314.1 hypothetical protein IVA73_04055 [Bradyrhizobium sp. 131]